MAGDHDKLLKTSLKNQLSALSFLIVLIAFLFLFITWLLLKNSDPQLIESMLIVCGIGFSLNTIPVLFLHYDYWEINKGEVYEVLFDRLVRWRQGKREEILGSDIKEIIIRKSASMDKGGIPFLGIESYYCVDVYLNSGNHLTLTCLLSPKIDLEIQKLKNIPIKRVKWLYNPVKSKTG